MVARRRFVMRMLLSARQSATTAWACNGDPTASESPDAPWVAIRGTRVSVELARSDAEQVQGLSVNGDNRAYPIRMLSRHEIVNDVVGGEPVAVTW